MSRFDVSDAFDPDFMDEVQVIRRPETVTDQGLSTVSPQSFYAFAIICAASPSALKRFEDRDLGEKTISITTEFKLFANVTGYKPDQLIWNGDTYELIDLQDYSLMGAGFVEAIATSIDYAQAAIPAQPASE